MSCHQIKEVSYISKWAPLSCNQSVHTLVLIPLDFSCLTCLSFTLQSTHCPVSTGNTTTLSRIHILHLSAVMISYCLIVSLCTFPKQSLASKIMPKTFSGELSKWKHDTSWYMHPERRWPCKGQRDKVSHHWLCYYNRMYFWPRQCWVCIGLGIFWSCDRSMPLPLFYTNNYLAFIWG